MYAVIGNVGAEHDSRVRTTDHEGTPAVPLAAGDESALVDREAHGAAFIVEEACVDRDGSGKGRGDLFHGLLRRGAGGGDQAQLRDIEINLKAWPEKAHRRGTHLEDCVRDPRRHDRKPRRLPPHRAEPGATHHRRAER